MTPENPHILIVDDHDDIRDGMMRYLRRHDFRVSEAAHAKEARDLIKRARIDVAILDIMMPGEDGLSLCRYITETQNFPVILLTAMGEDTDRIVGLEMGADDYLAKPFNPRELLARIKAVLRRTHALPPSLTQESTTINCRVFRDIFVCYTPILIFFLLRHSFQQQTPRPFMAHGLNTERG